MATAVPPAAGGFDRSEPIPGYKTVDLLGRGGFGEVWRAIAPGGIAKAVKIVYAEGDASRAEIELRALARIKDVRHPLLLSIERIELVHGNLVIVTELADDSLKNHFAALRQQQAIGVPQDELLRYIADTAEALDFLYERFSLQHLDVKPENILIVSGRGKLGDFGLVKNLYERTTSIVGGLTPTYAPPELFEGRPNRHSDQYSLAIVYMQMLTGVLPYSAANTAQLAAQHLRGVPDLTPLPKAQRPVIARALSKDPAQRYASCQEMVADLREASRRVEPAAEISPPVDNFRPQSNCPAPPIRSTAAAAILAPATGSVAPAQLSRAAGAVPHAAAPVEEGPQACEVDPPTLFIGVGGAGVEVIRKIVSRLRDRFGAVENWPPVEFLAIDSNARELSAQFQEDDLARVQVIPIPLKPAESYGSQAGNFLKWLGRKWFYNIPRDLTTGGYRPLGRLALLTHGSRTKDAIGAVISKVLGHAASAHKAKHGAGIPPAVSPRAMLVGSICGGTGGGAVLDLSYAVRGELKRRGLSDEQVHGVLLHSSPRSNSDRDKARANAYSTLHELDHYSAPGSHYPGEPLLGTPPFHSDNATFGRTYLLNMGDAVGPAEWELATDNAAEFVYGINFTPARFVLESNSGIPGRSATGGVCSYDVLALGAGSGPLVAQAVKLACSDVIKLWKEGCDSRLDPATQVRSERTLMLHTLQTYCGRTAAEVEAAARKLFIAQHLQLDDFLTESAEVVKLEVGADIEQFVRKIVDDSLAATDASLERSVRTVAMTSVVDRLLHGESLDTADYLAGDELFLRVVGRVNVRIRSRVTALMDSVRQLVDEPHTRIEGARQHAVAMQKILQSVQETAHTTAAVLGESALAIVVAARSNEVARPERSRFLGWAMRRKNPDDQLKETVRGYAEARLNELLHRTVAKIARIIDAEFSNLIEQLDRFARDLTFLSGSTRNSQDSNPAEQELPEGAATALVAYHPMLCGQLRQRRQDIARTIETNLERQISIDGKGVRRFVDEETDLQRLLYLPLVEASRRAVLSCIREINCQLIAACISTNNVGAIAELSNLILEHLSGDSARAIPDLVGRIVIVPEETEATALVARLRNVRPTAVVVPGHHCDLTFCSIRRHASLEQVAEEIISGVPLYRDLASCLHARLDISWRAFTDPRDIAPAAHFEATSTGTIVPTAVIPA